MKVKGFTLIELLAVIVILAIIALIATPIVLGIIDDTKKSAQLRSAEMYLSGVENVVMRENMKSGGNFRPSICTITKDGNLDCPEKDGILEVEVNGEKPNNGTITFAEGKIKEVTLNYNNATIVMDDNKKLIYANELEIVYKSLGNWQHQAPDGTIVDHGIEKGICAKCGENVLPSGLYKSDGTFVSWEQLLTGTLEYWKEGEYNEEKQDFDYYVEEHPIITVSEDGWFSIFKPTDGYSSMTPSFFEGKLVIDKSIVGISEEGLSSCSLLTDIEIPYTVKEIGKKAFYMCRGLTSIAIPNSITTLNDLTFWYCSNLTSVYIPDSVISISNGAFSRCEKLISIIVDENNPVYDSRENCNAIIYTATNTLIIGCQNTVIPNSIVSIGPSAFRYCTNLTSISIPDSVTSIGNSSFYNCINLTSINIPDSVTSIGSYAFEDCTKLESLILSKNLTKIEQSTFDGCSKLKQIILPEGITEIGASAFQFCTNLISINIPDSVTSIGSSAFRYCENLLSITIPNGVRNIESGTFQYCKKLTSIYIPSSVTQISTANGLRSNSPFIGCSSKLVIYCNASSNLSGWYTYWNSYSNSALLSVNYGISREEYNAIINNA